MTTFRNKMVTEWRSICTTITHTAALYSCHIYLCSTELQSHAGKIISTVIQNGELNLEFFVGECSSVRCKS